MIARVRAVVVVVLAACAALAGCTKKNYFECEASADCDFLTGGMCIQNPATGTSWCAAPDTTCPSGYRWDATAVGDDVASTCTPTTGPTCTPQIGWLSRRSGNSNVFAANLDGTDQHALTSSSVSEFRYSPIGDRFVYARDGGSTLKTMWIMSADGEDETQLTDGYYDFAAEWSASGDRVVFMRKRIGGPQYDLWVAVADTGALTNVASEASLNYEYPSFSPDGTLIAFDARGPGSESNLYVMDANGDNVSNLTDDTGSELTGGYEPPQWSPDGTSLLFTSNRSGDLEIWKASFPGGALTNLTQSPSSTDDTPRWSGDGDTIFFTRLDGADTELYSMNPDGSGQTPIEIADGSEFLYPRLSPDATKIAWASAQDGNYEIFTASLVERSAVRLTNDPANDEQPQWRSCP